MKTTITKDLENVTLTLERTFDAPVEKVWQAYAKQDLFEKWWSPEGWETTTKEFNFTPGGKIHYGMKCVDKNQGEYFGQESWGLMKIETIDAPHQFTAQDYFSDAEGVINESMPTQKFVVELVEENGKTKMINRSFPSSAEELEKLLQMGMAEGFDSQLNKLDDLLAS